MTKYYVKNNNYKHSNSDKFLYKALDTRGVKQITIAKCKSSRYLCRQKRFELFESRLSKTIDAVIFFIDLLSLGRSFEEIVTLLTIDENISFSYIQKTQSEENNIIFWEDTYTNNGLIFCTVTIESITSVKAQIKRYLRERTVKLGIQQTTTPLLGRKKVH